MQRRKLQVHKRKEREEEGGERERLLLLRKGQSEERNKEKAHVTLHTQRQRLPITHTAYAFSLRFHIQTTRNRTWNNATYLNKKTVSTHKRKGKREGERGRDSIAERRVEDGIRFIFFSTKQTETKTVSKARFL
jgi:hypothetical protein